MNFQIKYRYFLSFLLLALLTFSFVSCKNKSRNKDKKIIDAELSTLRQIQESGVLRAVTDYSSTSYYVYRGVPMGCQYEILMALCKDLGVRPEITVSNNIEETFDGLNEKRFDLVAKCLTVTQERNFEIAFTKPLSQTSQVIVQKKKAKNSSDSLFISSVKELGDKTVYVQKNSVFVQQLNELSAKISSPVGVVEDSLNDVEQLIAMVKRGEIEYTVSDENVALVNKSFYPELDVSLKISYPQNVAWAVRKEDSEWKEYLDRWIEKFIKTEKYNRIYRHYFKDSNTVWRYNSGFQKITGKKISEYDNLLKPIAEKNNWDWRLISSIIYHESNFDPMAEAWSGASGLMQLMPNTAESLGVGNIFDPKQNIEGGIKLLNWLNEQMLQAVPDSAERVKFVLAAYNIGLGHVKDARRLAAKYGKNSEVWENNVDYFLKNKSSEKLFEDPVVKWGYARGEEAYNFVSSVIRNYEHYRNLIPE